MLLHASLFEPSDAAARGTKPRELLQATPSAAAPRIEVKEEKQPHQRGAPGFRRPQPAAPTGDLALLHASLFEPGDAAARKTKPREMPQAAPSAAAPRTGVREEQQPRQRVVPGLRRLVATAHTCSANGGSSAAPRPAARAQRRLRARNKAQEDAAGASWCRCTKNRGQRGAAAAPEG